MSELLVSFSNLIAHYSLCCLSLMQSCRLPVLIQALSFLCKEPLPSCFPASGDDICQKVEDIFKQALTALLRWISL